MAEGVQMSRLEIGINFRNWRIRILIVNGHFTIRFRGGKMSEGDRPGGLVINRGHLSSLEDSYSFFKWTL